MLKTLRAKNIERQKEWDVNDQISPSYRAMELAGEVGEACNVIKKLERERMGNVGSRAELDDLADELGDVIICVDLICMSYGVDLGKAVKEKFNKTSKKNGLKTLIPLKEKESKKEEKGLFSKAAIKRVAREVASTEFEIFYSGSSSEFDMEYCEETFDNSTMNWSYPADASVCGREEQNFFAALDSGIITKKGIKQIKEEFCNFMLVELNRLEIEYGINVD